MSADVGNGYAERMLLVDALVELFERDDIEEDMRFSVSAPQVFTMQELVSELSVSNEGVTSGHLDAALRFLLSQGRIVRTVPGGGIASGYTRVASDESGKDAVERITTTLRQRAERGNTV